MHQVSANSVSQQKKKSFCKFEISQSHNQNQIYVLPLAFPRSQLLRSSLRQVESELYS